MSDQVAKPIVCSWREHDGIEELIQFHAYTEFGFVKVIHSDSGDFVAREWTTNWIEASRCPKVYRVNPKFVFMFETRTIPEKSPVVHLSTVINAHFVAQKVAQKGLASMRAEAQGWASVERTT